jgi:hypothetical protein
MLDNASLSADRQTGIQRAGSPTSIGKMSAQAFWNPTLKNLSSRDGSGTKSEYRDPKQTDAKQNSNRKYKTADSGLCCLEYCCVFYRFEFVSDLGFRATDFLPYF